MTNTEHTGRVVNAAIPLKQQKEVLHDLIRRPPQNSRVVEFSPELAANVLETMNDKGRRQRPISSAKVSKIAAAIQADEFFLTGDTIKFGTSGDLIDGQHRLAACVRSQRPIRTHAVFGLDDAIFPRLDLGKKRDGGDVFHIAAVPMPQDTAPTVRWLLLIENNQVRARTVYEPPELFRHYCDRYRNATNPKLEEAVSLAREIHRRTRQPVSMVAAVYFLACRKNRKKADEFFGAMARGSWPKSSVIEKLMALTQEKMTERNGRLHDGERCGMIVKAWNLFVAGRVGSKSALAFDPAREEFPAIVG